MPKALCLPLIALAFAIPGTVEAQSVNDYELPPKPTPTPTAKVQGPVDTESGALPKRPRVIEGQEGEELPPATAVDPAAGADTPLMVQPLPSPTPSLDVAAPVRTPLPRPVPSGLPTGQERLPLGTEQPPEVIPEPEVPVTSPLPEASPPQETLPIWQEWLWLLAGGGLLLLLTFGYLLTRRQREQAVPAIERPHVDSAPGSILPDQLKVSAEAIKLTRSVMNATLHYRVSLINRSAMALSNVTLGADIVSAHGELPVDQQVANAQNPLEQRHCFARIAPGQSVRYEGQISLPLSQAKLIHQGQAALFVPLLRVRLDGATSEPVVKTFVVGLGAGDGGRVMPFRIDQGPRSYQPIAARALD